jgi:dolichol-phosphate mannosyltransferase
VIIPTYNEAGNILVLAREVLAEDARVDCLVVDDNSPDGTGDLVARAMSSEPRLHLHRRPGKLGLGSAYLAGFRYGLDRDYGLIVTMDGDFSHHPRYLRPLLAAMDSHDMAIGSRYLAGSGILNWRIHRRLLSLVANTLTRRLLRLPVRDCTSGYRCYSREVLETVDPASVRGSGYSFLEEMAWRVHQAGFRIAEIPIIFENRRDGASKIDRAEIFRAAWHVLMTSVAPPLVPRQKRFQTVESREKINSPEWQAGADRVEDDCKS